MEKTLELILTGMILKRSREMRNAYEGEDDGALIDRAVKELAEHHAPVMEKLRAASS